MKVNGDAKAKCPYFIKLYKLAVNGIFKKRIHSGYFNKQAAFYGLPAKKPLSTNKRHGIDLFLKIVTCSFVNGCIIKSCLPK